MWVVFAIFGDFVTPYDPLGTPQDILNRLQPPSSEHWIGTDDLGRDVLSRVLAGARQVLTIALGATIIGTISEFKRGAFPAGIRAGVVAMHSVIGGDYGPLEQSSRKRRGSGGAGGVFLFGFVFLILAISRRRGRGGGGTGGSGGLGAMLPWLVLSSMSSGGRSSSWSGGGSSSGGGGGFGGFGGFGGGGGFSGGGASGGW
jgi:uncharacterized protein